MQKESSELTLAQKILVWIGKIASRNDITIEKIKVPLGEKLSKWSEILPSDMLPLYNQINGVSFYYKIGENTSNGLNIIGLDADGKGTFNPYSMTHSMPFQKAKSFGEYFLNEESKVDITSDSEVLFFFGQDSAWGILMVGRGEDATFYKWGNDGDIHFIDKTYSEILEQGIERNFGTSWFNDQIHLDNQKLLDMLAVESPKKTFELTIDEMEEFDAHAYRYYLGKKQSTYTTHKFMEALGQSIPKNWTPDQYGEWVAETFSSLASFKLPLMKEIMKIIGEEKTKKAFENYFRIGNEEVVVHLKLILKKQDGDFSDSGASELLLRTLCSLPESSFCHDYPNRELILYTMYLKWGFYRPYLFFRDSNYYGEKRNANEMGFDLVVLKSRVNGLNAGKTYDSFVLGEYYESYYPKINTPIMP